MNNHTNNHMNNRKRSWTITLTAIAIIGLGCSVGSKVGLGDPGDSSATAGGEDDAVAAGDSPKQRRLDKKFTEVLKDTGDECAKLAGADVVFNGIMKTDKLSPGQCGLIGDGIRYVCQDNKESADFLAKTIARLSDVHCEFADPSAKTASVVIKGSTLRVAVNIDMADPSEKVRCQIARKLELDYKGDLDEACVDRSHK